MLLLYFGLPQLKNVKFKETEKVADSLENIFMRKMPVMHIQ